MAARRDSRVSGIPGDRGDLLTQVGARAIGVACVAAAIVALMALFNRGTVAWMGESTRHPSR